jgi:hypothetical protein
MTQLQAPSILPTHNAARTEPLIPLQNIPTLQNMPTLGPPNGSTTDSPNKPAWKVQGYQAFSKWMASENDFFVFRRFESLNANTILWMQYQISELEEKLEQIHKEIEVSEKEHKLRNSSFKWDEEKRPDRNLIMGQLAGLLLQYSEYVIWGLKTEAQPYQINS